MSMQIREATLQDAQLIADLTRAAWAGKVAASSSGHRETAEAASYHLQIGGGFILLINDQAVGSVRWLPLPDQPGTWEMLRMSVLPAYRGANLSQQLIEAVIQQACLEGVTELRLAVRADQPRLLDLYSAYEFEEAPELEYTHANPLEAAPTVMRRILKS